MWKFRTNFCLIGYNGKFIRGKSKDKRNKSKRMFTKFTDDHGFNYMFNLKKGKWIRK